MMTLRRALLFVKDTPRMTAFYRDGFGLRVVTESPGWVELDAAGITLCLHAIPEAIARDIVITSPPQRREETPIKLVFETDDVGEARARLVAAGAVMGEMTSWGACDGLDPEGNVFQIGAAAGAPAG